MLFLRNGVSQGEESDAAVYLPKRRDLMGRRAHKPDAFHRRQVEAMAAYGVPETSISRVVGIDPKILRKHYREELDTGQVKATAKVAESLFRKATAAADEAARRVWKLGTRHWRALPSAVANYA
jgi:hypothetical protein